MLDLLLSAVNYFNYYYYFFLFIWLEIFLFFYKCFNYPMDGVWSEASVLVLLSCSEGLRIRQSSVGIISSRYLCLGLALALMPPSVLALTYLLHYQTYVLYLEIILVAIELTFEAIALPLLLIKFIALLYYKL